MNAHRIVSCLGAVGFCAICCGQTGGVVVARGADARSATNLVANGGFERAAEDDPRRPDGWDLPDGLGIQWEPAPEGGAGRAIRMDTRVSEIDMVRSWQRAGLTNAWNIDIPKPAANAISDTYGLSFYSEPFAIVSGQNYRVSCRLRGTGGFKVWVRGYGLFNGRLRRRYEALLNGKSEADRWTDNEMVFNPTHHRPDVTEMRVMLYAYYPPGVYWFDDLRVEPVAPPADPAGR